eukprot:symbB.v1.2.029031.t1/scaffold3135.1/size62805/1
MAELAGAARASLLVRHILAEPAVRPLAPRFVPLARPWPQNSPGLNSCQQLPTLRSRPPRLGYTTMAVAMVGSALAAPRCNKTSLGAVAVSAETREVKAGDEIYVNYEGRLEDGTVFDSREGKEPLYFTVGTGQVVRGFDKAVRGLKVGEKKTVTIPAEAHISAVYFFTLKRA